MKKITPIEIVATDGLAVIAAGRTTLIAASAHMLTLYGIGLCNQGLWVRTGRHRPFRTEAPMAEIIHEAQVWIEELEVASVHRLAS